MKTNRLAMTVAAITATILLILSSAGPVEAAKVKAGNSIVLNGPAVGWDQYQRFTIALASSIQYPFVRISCWPGQTDSTGAPGWTTDSFKPPHVSIAPAMNPGLLMGFGFDFDSASATYGQQVIASGWTGGPAYCTAEVDSYRASTFTVAGPIAWTTP